MNEAFRDAASESLRGILGYTDEPLVSIDFKGDPRSSIFDSLSTMVLGRQPGEGARPGTTTSGATPAAWPTSAPSSAEQGAVVRDAARMRDELSLAATTDRQRPAASTCALAAWRQRSWPRRPAAAATTTGKSVPHRPIQAACWSSSRTWRWARTASTWACSTRTTDTRSPARRCTSSSSCWTDDQATAERFEADAEGVTTVERPTPTPTPTARSRSTGRRDRRLHRPRDLRRGRQLGRRGHRHARRRQAVRSRAAPPSPCLQEAKSAGRVGDPAPQSTR